MKRILLFISLFLCSTLSAQTLLEPFCGTEPARGEIIPYGRASDALKDNKENSNFVAKLTPWTIAEDGREYTTSFAVPVWWLNRQVIVRVGHATSAYRLFVDGHQVGFAASGATPVEFNITKVAKEGRHTLTIKLVEAEQNRVNALSTTAPKVEQVDVLCQPTLRIRDILCSTTINDNNEGVAEFAVVVKCNSLNAKHARIDYKVHLNDSTVVDRGSREITLDMRREDTVRFMTRIPKVALWSTTSPHRITLELANSVSNRPAEYICRKVGVRSVDVLSNTMYINRMPVQLHLTYYDPTKPIQEQIAGNTNGVILPAHYATEQLLTECDNLGVLVFVQASIDTLPLSESIRRGGNPSNDPFWLETYLSFNLASYYTTRSHPSVVGFALASGKTNGINIYESYLMLKNIEKRLPVIYQGAGGEWCSDVLPIH